MTKREEAIEVMARAICRRTCLHIGGPDCETLVTGKPNWVFHRFEAEVAFDAVVKVLMEPDGAMLDAARDWSVAKYGLGVGNEGASGCLQAMLKEAAK